MIDGFRQRRELTRRLSLSRLARLRYSPPPLLVASVFGFALLAVDSASSYVLYNLTELVVSVSGGDSSPQPVLLAYQVSGGIVQAVFVFVMAALLTRSATYRIARARKRWVWFGMAVFLVVRVAMLVATQASFEGTNTALLIAAAFVATPMLAWPRWSGCDGPTQPRLRSTPLPTSGGCRRRTRKRRCPCWALTKSPSRCHPPPDVMESDGAGLGD